MGKINILVDPVMSQLDFGIPLLYRGNKRFLDSSKEIVDLANRTDYVLISQGFDDHAHGPTIQRLTAMRPSLAFICPPSATSILQSNGAQREFIYEVSHGEQFVATKDRSRVVVRATEGALLGPPWRRRENGYILSSDQCPSIYYEPHCQYNEKGLRGLRADVVVSPVVSQELPGYALVSGGRETLRLARALRAKVIVPLRNGELKQEGPLANIIRSVGTEEEFKALVKREAPEVRVVCAEPGVRLSL